jgi:hypothetical protein
MKYSTEMGSSAMVYVLSSGIQMLLRWDSKTHREHGDCISLFYESRLKTILFSWEQQKELVSITRSSYR